MDVGDGLITLFVESNFLLEIVRQQEDARSAEKILDLAVSGKVKVCCSGAGVG
jgi:hypothetical protein